MSANTLDKFNNYFPQNFGEKKMQLGENLNAGNRLGMVVVFAADLFDLSSLMAGVRRGANTLQLRPERDAIAQITAALEAAPFPVKSLHVVAHGSANVLGFGNNYLSLENLEQYSALFRRWNVPEILLYGCNLARKNTEFLEGLHRLTDANIAASDTPVGCSDRGGNWRLDVKIGEITSGIAFVESVQKNYRGLLTIERVSINSQGEEAAADGQNLGSQDGVLSTNSRFVAFESNAENLVPDDNNGVSDVFVRDRETGITERVSINSFGQEGNDRSGAFSDAILPALTPDGRFVAFESKARNLAPGDNNAEEWDIFVHDRQTGTTARISIDNDSVGGNGSSRNPVITPGGRFVAFESLADNLDPRDQNQGAWDIFVRDRDPDGNGIFDEENGITRRMSINGIGREGNDDSFDPSISGDGRFVVFESDANNLVAGDTNGVRDIFLFDQDPDGNGIFEETIINISRISTGINGVEANNGSFDPQFSGNNRFIVFESLANNLVPGDSNNALDIFVYDTQTGLTNRVSIDANGFGGNLASSQPSISDDGRFVGFSSASSNFAVGDNNGFEDIFVHDRDPDRNGIFDEGNGITTRISISDAGQEGNENSFQSVVSGDGNLVAFESFANNLIPGDTNGVADIFISTIDPTITILSGVNPIEGGLNGTFEIRLNQPAPPEGLTVNFNIGGEATNSLDYRFAAGNNIANLTASSFTIVPGATEATLEVIPVFDNINEADETVTIDLQPGTGYGLTTLNTASLIIGDRSLVVENTNDSGTASLREVIETANQFGGTDIITFNIPQTDPGFNPETGTFTIRPLSPLPAISEAAILDATSQPGYADRPLIELDGTNVNGSTGLTITAGNSTIKGFVINRFGEGIRLIGGGNNTVRGNYIGTDVSGNIDLGNGEDGIFLGAGTAGNLIGGTASEDRNLISGNGRHGVQLDATANNIIQGNYIGSNRLGTGDLGNSGAGINIFQGGNNQVGGTASGAGNIISGNDTNGIQLDGEAASNNRIEGNFIGTTPDGNTPLGNAQNGIFVLNNANNNTVGGGNFGGNIIAYNSGDGVAVLSGDGNGILGNSIFDNGLAVGNIGIDLNDDGITENDVLDGDAGANGLQNYPVLTGAILKAKSIEIQGVVNGSVGSIFNVQFFANEPLGLGERQGRIFLGEIEAISGEPFAANFDIELGENQRTITATATDINNNNTSEFSDRINANIAPILDLDEDDSSGTTGNNYSTRFIEGRNPVSVADADVGIEDGDSPTLASATLTLTNPLNGNDEILAVSGRLPPTIRQTIYDPTTQQLQLFGDAPLADYQTAISQVVYNNNTINPDLSARRINISVNDGTSDSNVAETIISLISTVQVSIVANISPTEGEIGNYTITLDEPVDTPLIVEFNPGGSLATERVDYALEAGEGIANITPNTVTIAPGVTAATLNVVTVDDEIFDPRETVQLNLVEGSNYLLNENSSAFITIADNDNADIVFNPPAEAVTTEEGESVEFEYVLTSEPTADVIINLENGDQTEGNLSAETLTFTPENWNVTQVVTVTGVDDNTVDGDVNYTIVTDVTSGDIYYNDFELEDVSLTNRDNDEAGIIFTPPVELLTTENGGSVEIEYVLTSQPTANVIINLESSNPNEGNLSAETLTFTPENWNLPQVVTVAGVDDNVVDGNVEYTVTSAVVSEDVSYNNFQLENVTLTNEDNDEAGIIFTPPVEPATTEAGDGVNLEFVLTSQPTADVIIELENSDPTEGNLAAETLTFTPENWNNSQIVAVTGLDDNIVDGDVGYSINTTVFSEDLTYNNFNLADINLTNRDNDERGIIITPTDGLQTTEAGDTATFEIVLTSEPAAEVRLNLNSSNPNEGSLSISEVLFTPENWNVPQIVIVSGVDDNIVDGNLSYSIITGETVSNDPIYNGINPPDVNLINADNETSGITVTPVNGLATTEGGGSDSFEIFLNTEPVDEVTIGLASNDITEGIVSVEAVTFTPENWNIPQMVTVTGVDDDIDDDDIGYSIITTPDFETEDPNYNRLKPANINVTNTDNDAAEILIASPTGLTTSEVGGTATFDVVLASEPVANVRLNLASSNLTEGILSAEILTFTPENWNLSQAVTVTGVDDNIADGDANYTIIIGEAVSDDPKYNGINPDDIAAINTDNETPGITVSPTGGLETGEGGETATFEVVLNTRPTDNVTLNLSSDNPAEGLVFPAGLTFTPENWNTPQIVAVTGVDDGVVDGDIEYRIITESAISNDPNYNNRNPENVTLINRDNDLPRIDLSADLTAGEEANTTAITLTVTASANVEGEQTVNLDISGIGITSNDYSLSNSQITIPDGQNTASVTFQVLDDVAFEGDETATLTLSNPTEGIVLGVASVNIAIVDNDTPATVEFSETDYQINEDGTIVGAEITINRTGDTSTASTVDVELTQETATAGEDFDNGLISVRFAANQKTATVNIPIFEDDLVEEDETFSLALVNAGPGTEIGSQNSATVEIIDNEVARIDISQTELSVTEAGITDSYSLVLTTIPTEPVTIRFQTDSQIQPIAEITFDETNWNIPQTVAVQAVDDDAVEDRTHSSLITHVVTSNDPNYNGFILDDVDIEIAENDIVDVSIAPGNIAVSEDGETDSYSFVLTRQPDLPVTIQFEFDEQQINPISPVTFDSTNWNTPQTVTVEAIDDLLVEGDETLAISHSVVSEDENYRNLQVRAVNVEIADNDVDAEIFINTRNLSITEGETTATYEIVLSSPPAVPVTIEFNTGDRINAIPSIEFDENNWNIPQTVTVVAENDDIVRGNTGEIISHRVRSADRNYDGLEVDNVIVNVAENDVAEVLITRTSNRTEVSENGLTDTYEVVLSSQPAEDVIVTVTPDSQVNLGRGAETEIELIFTPENWNEPQTVTVEAVDDEDVEADIHTSTINHSVSGGDPNYNGDTPIKINGIIGENLTVDIVENDEPLPPGNPGISLVQPVRRTDVIEGFGSDVYKLVLNSEPTANVEIQINPNSQVETDKRTLTFTPSNWNVPQAVTVTAVDDNAVEDSHSGTISHSVNSEDSRYNNLQIDELSVNISDNDNIGLQNSFSEATVTAMSPLDDTGVGSDFEDILFGNGGNDRLSGEGSLDLIYGQEGADGLSGEIGDDVLFGGQGPDQLQGGAGNDIIYGDKDSDRLWGGEGNDRLFGDFGNDRLVGDAGADILTGGLGNDAFAIGFGTGGNTAENADIIVDFTDTQDVIELIGSLTFEQLNIFSIPNGTAVQVQSTGEFLAVLPGVNPGLLTEQDFV